MVVIVQTCPETVLVEVVMVVVVVPDVSVDDVTLVLVDVEVVVTV